MRKGVKVRVREGVHLATEGTRQLVLGQVGEILGTGDPEEDEKEWLVGFPNSKGDMVPLLFDGHELEVARCEKPTKKGTTGDYTTCNAQVNLRGECENASDHVEL